MAAALAAFSHVAVGDDVENVQRVCSVIDAMGAATECAVNAADRTVDVTADTSGAEAAKLCTAFSGMVVALTSSLSDHWKMRVFSPQSTDTPVAVCDLT